MTTRKRFKALIRAYVLYTAFPIRLSLGSFAPFLQSMRRKYR